MKKCLIVFLFVIIASCNNENTVTNPPVNNSFDDIVLTKVPPNDSVTNIYGLNLSTMNLRYITNLGIITSNVFNNKALLVKIGYFYYSSIYLYDIKTNVYSIIPRGNDYPFYVNLSPDANKVLYTCDDGNLLIVINADGTNRRVFSTDIRGTESLAEFSHDGKRIAYVEKDQNYKSAIYIIDTSGNNKIKVLEIEEPNSGDTFNWSLDNKTIVFSNKNSSFKYNICIVNTDGSGFVNLTNSGFNQWHPEFSPDGLYIAFQQDGSSGIPDVMIMNSDGSNVVNITNTVSEYERLPMWSPDGKKLLFSKSQSSGYSKYYIYDIAAQKSVSIDSVFNAVWNYTN